MLPVCVISVECFKRPLYGLNMFKVACAINLFGRSACSKGSIMQAHIVCILHFVLHNSEEEPSSRHFLAQSPFEAMEKHLSSIGRLYYMEWSRVKFQRYRSYTRTSTCLHCTYARTGRRACSHMLAHARTCTYSHMLALAQAQHLQAHARARTRAHTLDSIYPSSVLVRASTCALDCMHPRMRACATMHECVSACTSGSVSACACGGSYYWYLLRLCPLRLRDRAEEGNYFCSAPTLYVVPLGAWFSWV